MESLSTILEELSDSFTDNFSERWSASPSLVILGVVGGLFLTSHVFNFLRMVASLYILPGKPLSSFHPKTQSSKSWALITGPTDGLGLHFTHTLARANYNLLLASRSASKLSSLQTALQKTYPTLSVKIVPIDFSTATPQDYTSLQTAIHECSDIGVLINNVGKSHAFPVPFADTSSQEMEDIIEINVRATLKVTSMVVPAMISQKRGLVLTMGSFAGLIPTPLLATYSGSKAFLQYWSSALGSELAPHGITVELVQSYSITGGMSKIRRASALVPGPEEYVGSVMRRIGRTGGAQGFAYTSTPYWGHAVMEWFLGTVAGFTGAFVVGRNKVMHEDIRRRALRRAERERGKKGQ
ncbi:hypothetical protein MMC10_010182 [Thelotrema lepadinum]|nr:hypothetical protein [Thelotrema lepadinum]